MFIFSPLGHSEFVIEELNKYVKTTGANVKCHAYSYKENLSDIIKVINETAGKKKILLLSSDDVNAENQDEEIFLSALAFKLNGCLDKETEVLAEITNPSNLNPLKNFGVMSVIVSNRIISLFMVQLLTHPGSKKFYRDIISTNDENGVDAVDLEIVSAGEVLKFNGEDLTFICKSELVQSFYTASNKTRMCIGVKKQNESEILFLCDKMDEVEELVITPTDELVLVSY